MARTVLTVHKIDDTNKPLAPASYADMLATPDTDTGAEFAIGKDHKTMILLVNDGGNTATATVKAGNGIQGVNDLVVSLDAGKFTFVCLDSGRFKNMSGTDKGKVILTGTAKVAVFELP